MVMTVLLPCKLRMLSVVRGFRRFPLSWIEALVQRLQQSGLALLSAYVFAGVVIVALQLTPMPGIFLQPLGGSGLDRASRAHRHGTPRVAGNPQDNIEGLACAADRLLHGRILLAPCLDAGGRGGSCGSQRTQRDRSAHR